MQLPCLSPVAISFPRAEHGVVIRSGFHSCPVNFQQTQETHHIPYELKVWLKCITGIGQISYLHNVLIHVYRNLATMTLLYHWYNFHSNLEYSNLLMTWERGAWVNSPAVVSCVCVWTPSWSGDCVKNRAIDFPLQGLWFLSSLMQPLGCCAWGKFSEQKHLWFTRDEGEHQCW